MKATTRTIAIAAILIAAGNMSSRLVGAIREVVISALFGIGPEMDAFTLAWTVPNTVYDLLISGAISAALVPVLSAYAEQDEDEFWRVAASVATIVVLVLAALVLLLLWQAPLVATLVVREGQPGLREEVTRFIRWMLPAVFAMGLSGLITAVLYARQRFLLPAFTVTLFNLGIIAGALTLHRQLGVASLVVGTIAGALLQVLLQLPGLRAARLHGVRLNHPGVRRVLVLYAPVAIGVGFSVIGTLLDRRLASGFEGAASTMRYATTLIQLPLGLVAAAVSFAVLPTLSRQASAGSDQEFRVTLAMGLKVVLLLIVPAAAGMAALATPLVGLAFQRLNFTPDDTGMTAMALLLYLPGLPAAALDQMLLFAFYARRRTLTPNLVQGAAILLYALSALALIGQIGFYGLVVGNSVQWIGHALIMLVLAQRLVRLRGLGLGRELRRVALAGVLMAAVVRVLDAGLVALGGPSATLPARTLVGALAGATLYFGLCLALRVEALGFFTASLRRRLARSTPAGPGSGVGR